MIEELTRQAQQHREEYIEALTNVAMQALHNAGLSVTRGSRGHQELHDAIETAARGI